MAAVNASLRRISGTVNDLAIVVNTALVLDHLAGAARGLDALARGGAEAVGVDGQGLAQLAPGQDLDRDVLALGQAPLAQPLGGDLGAGVEARLQVGQVDRLGLRAEGLERHRLLHVRAAQLAHPHVDGVLTTLEARPPLGSRPRTPALLAAACGLARARALPSTHALARLTRARSRLQVVQAHALLSH